MNILPKLQPVTAFEDWTPPPADAGAERVVSAGPPRVRRLGLGVIALGLAAGTAFGWVGSMDSGTALRISAERVAELQRDNNGLEAQVSSLQSSLATCKQAAGEMAGIAIVLSDGPELVARAAQAVKDDDLVELGWIAATMAQLDERLNEALDTSSGAIDVCTGAFSA